MECNKDGPRAGLPGSRQDRHSVASRLSKAWDAEYAKGRYHGEMALGFSDDIIREVVSRPNLRCGSGLYVGCGNGRNYVKLAEAGLRMVGIDVSGVALADLSKRLPRCSHLLHRGDFLDYEQDAPFQYVIAIQVFQHGDMNRVEKYFEKTSALLETGGLLFLRVNSSNTIVQNGHDVVETNDAGGFTVRYDEGPKNGLDIRFFSEGDVCGLVRKHGMSVVGEPRNVTTKRAPPGTGSWSQWEIIARKNTMNGDA